MLQVAVLHEPQMVCRIPNYDFTACTADQVLHPHAGFGAQAAGQLGGDTTERHTVRFQLQKKEPVRMSLSYRCAYVGRMHEPRPLRKSPPATWF